MKIFASLPVLVSCQLYYDMYQQTREIENQLGLRYDSAKLSSKAPKQLSYRLLSEAFDVPKVEVFNGDEVFLDHRSPLEHMMTKIDGEFFDLSIMTVEEGTSMVTKTSKYLTWCACDGVDHFACYVIHKDKPGRATKHSSLCKKPTWSLTPLCKGKTYSVDLDSKRKEAKKRYFERREKLLSFVKLLSKKSH